MFPEADFLNTFTMIADTMTLYEGTKKKYHFSNLLDRDSLLFTELLVVLAFFEIP